MAVKKDEYGKYFIIGKYKDENNNFISYKKYTGRNAFVRKKDAIKAENEFLSTLSPDEEIITFGDVMEMCLQDDLLRNKKSTIYTTRKRLKKINYIFKEDIRYISSSRLKDILSTLNSENLSLNYLDGIHANLSKIFNYALKHELIEKSPMITVERVRRADLIVEKNKYWTPEQFKIFLAEVENDVYSLFFETLYGLGCRKGEALALSWEDINFTDGTVNINKTLKGSVTKPEKTSLKNGTKGIRKISIPKTLLNSLVRYKSECENKFGYSIKWYVFGGIEPLSTTSLGRAFHTALSKGNGYCDAKNIVGELKPGNTIHVDGFIYYNKEGMGGAKTYKSEVIVESISEDAKRNVKIKSTLPKITIHGLRHSHVSLLINNGANTKGIADRIGDSLETTLRVYAHLFTETDKEIAKMLDDLIY